MKITDEGILLNFFKKTQVSFHMYQPAGVRRTIKQLGNLLMWILVNFLMLL